MQGWGMESSHPRGQVRGTWLPTWMQTACVQGQGWEVWVSVSRMRVACWTILPSTCRSRTTTNNSLTFWSHSKAPQLGAEIQWSASSGRVEAKEAGKAPARTLRGGAPPPARGARSESQTGQ